MKSIQNIFLLVFFLLSVTVGYGQTKAGSDEQKLSFKVWGNCDMCKTTIEESLDVKGVKSANWNVETKILNITFIPSKISEEKLHKLIAASGYDTEKAKGDDKAYDALPGCCHYDRKK